MLASFAPRIYAEMRSTVQQVFEHHGLSLNFKRSVYPAVTFNLGPATECVPHVDAANDPINWCHITALGRFNSKKGGHLLLLKPRVCVEFPPGANVWIPSAIVPHANVMIQPGETRRSMTQYCSGSLRRWLECGFRTLGNFALADPSASEALQEQLHTRAEERVALFSTLESLEKDREALMKGEL